VRFAALRSDLRSPPEADTFAILPKKISLMTLRINEQVE
jgi:hypothetical protein